MKGDFLGLIMKGEADDDFEMLFFMSNSRTEFFEEDKMWAILKKQAE